jgi:DNA-directed RNA polymerase specialized sigma24 family protein
MRRSNSNGQSSSASGGFFRSTHWSVVRQASDLNCPSAHEALTKLCLDYWYPLYAYVRRRGYSHEDAQDLTQEFFARLIEKRLFAYADQARGCFRSFLLSAIDHFLNHQWKKSKAIKRGGQQLFIPFDELGAELRYGHEPFSNLSPEKLYERRWAIVLLEKTAEKLRLEHESAGERPVFENLQGFISADPDQESYQTVAVRLHTTADSVRMRVFRLRRRFRQLLREVVADTVAPGEIDEEIRHLREVWD